MRLIFEPSSVRLYMRPAGSRMKPSTGSSGSRVDGAAGAERHDGHRSVDADLPAIGAFEACERRSVMNMMMTVRACTPS